MTTTQDRPDTASTPVVALTASGGDSAAGHGARASILRQPMAVWAVAFASVVSFMGIGLVDPILPAIARDLQASPAQTELLFTTYLAITGLAMFFTSWVSTRIGAKKTLLIGLAVIVVFAALAGMSGNVDQIIGFRAGWGFGNALFISTALATIVGAASGGAAAAIVLYEAALGLGIAIGPLIGGLLGSVSWQAPFFGTAALMAIAFVVITVMLRREPERPAPTKLSAPFRALATPGLGVVASAAVFYNMGFFVLLAYTPFVLEAQGMGSAITLGLIFCGWGLALAITSVWVAPFLTARMRRTSVLKLVLPLLAVVLVLAAVFSTSVPGLITCVIVGGLLLGILNTVLTECSMEATDLPRPVASSAYSGVRFLGGAVAPPLAALIGDWFGAAIPFVFAAIVVMIAFAIIALGRKALARADAAEEHTMEVAEAISLGDAD